MCNLVVDQLVTDNDLQEVLFSKIGVPLAAGVVTFYRQQDMTTLKNVYYLNGTGSPYVSSDFVAAPNPMVLSATGSTVDVNGNDVLLFYYPYLDQDPLCDPNQFDPYFITVYDANGQFQFSRSYFPFVPGEGGGPSPGPVIPTLDNYLINNRFWRNIGAYNPTGFAAGTLSSSWTTQYALAGTIYYQTLAPSQHDGFSMPDFNYIKNVNGSSTETISFLKFPGASSEVISNDIQPEFYINHHCVSDTSGSTLKAYQFPISLHLATLANQPWTFTIQGQCTSGNPNIQINIYQFAGTGVISPMPLFSGQITLTSTWEKYFLFGSFPGTALITPSATNDDAYYIQIAMPTGTDSGSPNAQTNINFCLPSIYLSNSLNEVPTNNFQTYDQIDSIIAAPRTGDIKNSLSTFYPYGWVPMSGGTLCNIGAVTVPTNEIGIIYQASDGWQLFYLLWTLFKAYDNAGVNPVAQMYSNIGVAVAYGASAYADWVAVKQLAVTNTMGRMLLGTVPPLALPVVYNSLFTASPLTAQTVTASSGPSGLLFTVSATFASVAFGEVVCFTSSGSLPGGVAGGTDYWCVPNGPTTFYIATSLVNAQNGTVLAYSTAGTPTIVYNTSTPAAPVLVLTIANAFTPSTMNLFRGQPITFSTTGTLPSGLSINTIYYAVPTGNATTGTQWLCVATSFANAMNGTLYAYTNIGAGTYTISTFIGGMTGGEYAHQQIGSELASHNHTGTVNFALPGGTVGGAGVMNIIDQSGTTALLINNRGDNVPFNVTSPYLGMNMFIKL